MLSNFIYQGFYQVLLIILPIITTPIVSRALGPAGIGIWNYVSSIVNYFVLFAGLGLANYAVREIAYVKKDKKKLSEKFWEIQFFNLLFSCTVFIIYLLMMNFFEYEIYFLIQSMIVFATILDISWFFQGIENFKQVIIPNLIIKLISFILTILLVKDKSDLVIYFLLNSMNILFTNLVFWFFLKEKIFWVKVKLNKIWGHFLPSLSFFILKLSSTLFNNINKTLLGLISTVTSVGIFSNSLTMITMVGAVVNTLNIVMLPRMSNLERENDSNKFINVLQKSIHFQLFVTIAMMFGIIALNANFVSWFFGPEFKQIEYIVPILAPVVVLQALQQGIANQYLVPKNKMFAYNITMIIGTIVNVIIGIAFIPYFDVYGAAYAFLFGQIILGLSRSRALIKGSTFKFNWGFILLCIISGIMMLITVELLTFNMKPKILTTVAQILIGMMSYMVYTFIFKVNMIWDMIKKYTSKY